jgi:hypothetical protein
MTYAQYIQKFVGKTGWLSQNPHGWFEFTLRSRPSAGRTFEVEHTINEIHDDFVVVASVSFPVFFRSIPLSLIIFQG